MQLCLILLTVQQTATAIMADDSKQCSIPLLLDDMSHSCPREKTLLGYGQKRLHAGAAD
jgi:hypothetical protein